ncbi:pyocin knob domain-containing protein, partial [Clostridium sp.]|uniref:pyocin knob domain-containing protein n=1 Tax=Clostridium sp. TaxID=1506 RepID=UPI0029085EA7
ANGNLSYDGLTMQIIGKIINVLNGYGVEMDQGGLMFATNGEVVGGIRSSRYTDNLAINGLSIVNTRDGDYTDIGFTNSENFEGNTDFYPVLRISKIVNQLLGNFKGIQLLENTRLANMKTFYLESNDSKFPHEIYNTAGGLLALFGDNGVMLGYMSGAEKVKVLELAETVGEGGIQAMFYKNLSMAGNKILGVSDIFTGTTSHRYHHAGWCGSIEATAKRISNLNVYYESGWYAYSSGSQGAPSSYGVMLHLKWGETDFAQIAFDFANNMYQRAWVNGAWTNWTQR